MNKIKSGVTFKFSLFILLVLFTLIMNTFISCDVKSESKFGDNSINIIDSIYVDGVYDLEFLDINLYNQSLLFYSLDQKMIFLLDRKSKETIKIPFPGQSKSASGYAFKSASFFSSDSKDSIVIWTDKGYHFYDNAGNSSRDEEFKSNYFHPTSVFFKVVHKNDDLLAIQRHGREYLKDETLSKEKSKFIQTYNFTNKELNLYKGFQDDNPTLASGDFLLKASFEDNKFLHVLLSPDNTISTYSIEDKFNLVRSVKMDIPYYSPSYQARNSNKDLLLQPNIYWLFSDSQYFYIVYKPNIDPEKIDINFSNNGLLDDSSFNSIPFYLYKHDRSSGEGHAIPLPHLLVGFKAILENDLYLVQPSALLKESEKGNVFYIVALE